MMKYKKNINKKLKEFRIYSCNMEKMGIYF